MEQVSLRDFQLKASSYLKDLPIVLTVYNVPTYIVSAHVSADKDVSTDVSTKPKENSKKIIPEKTEDKTSPGAPQVATPFVEEEFHECSWDKTFNCRSPAPFNIRGKWYCIVHAKEV